MPLPPITATKAKLAEADFFHRKLLEAGRRQFSNEPEAFGCYLSAFVSAGRSVSLVLQVECPNEYKAWFEGWATSLTEDERTLLMSFNTHRVDTVHLRGIEVTAQLEEITPGEFYFAASREGVQISIWHPPGVTAPPFHKTVRTLALGGTDAEVLIAASAYFGLVNRLVRDFLVHHGEAAA